MLPPFNWRASRQRQQWLLLASAAALVALVSSGLNLAIKAVLALPLIGFAVWQWPERGPERISWRDQLLWLDDCAYHVAGKSASIWPCWVLLLSDARSQSQRRLLLWPDSLAKEELRQLRVALATHSR